MTYEILRFHECFWGLLCWACWLGTLAWLVERNGFAEREFGCVQLTTHRHYTSVYNTVSFFVYNITTIILRIFFIWINRGQLLDFWSMRLCDLCDPGRSGLVEALGRLTLRTLEGSFRALATWREMVIFSAIWYCKYFRSLYDVFILDMISDCVYIYIYTAHKYTFYTVWFLYSISADMRDIRTFAWC